MIFIALGANLPSIDGAHRETLRRALPHLERHGLRVTARSRIWLTEPVPRSDDPWYANQVIAVTTILSPHETLSALLAVEQIFGRIRTSQNAPRTLDLDLITYHDHICADDTLILPHPRMAERAFVLAPLTDIAPDFVHPITGKPIADLLEASDRSGIRALKDVPLLMGVINVTPDSFSDGNQFFDHSQATRHAETLIEQGADILDIGGESTRPNAKPVSPKEEQARIMPVIKAIADTAAKRGRLLSVDTRHAATMAMALDAGATMINDVSALADPDAARIIAKAGVPVILMHMRGTPQTMQIDPSYSDVIAEVGAFLASATQNAVRSGISADSVWIDPGIGFGKTLAHNLALLDATRHFASLGHRLLIGASRKAFIGKIDRDGPAAKRLGGSIAAALAAAERGAHAVRVHDVEETRQALAVWSAI